jgi:ATP-binding cassette, subfamily C (CFTR/MRP), member 1
MHRVIRNSARSLHAQLLDTALRAPFPYISKQDIGSLLNRFNQDLMLIDTQLPLSILNTNSSLFTALMKIILITISVIYLLAVLPPLFLVLFLIQNFYLCTSKQLRHLDLESKAALHTKFLETCSGLTTIRAFNWGEKLNAEFLDLLDRSQEPFYLLPSVQSWLQLVLNLIVAGITILVLGVAISIERKVKPAAIGVAFLNATTLGETLTHFIVSWTSLETSLGAIARISSFVKTTPREKEPAVPEDVSHDWPSRGGIEFKNVWASYDSNLASDEGEGETMFCLKDINLSISPGEKVAVCGRTGSGKSSLVLALLSMLSLSSGSILIDGVDISHISLSTLRRWLNTVPQDVFALAKTNREELDSRGGVSDNEIIYVLERCGIWEKVLEEGGLDGRAETAKFSAGEAQLYCFARAVLKSETVGGGVVVIDEATSRYVVPHFGWWTCCADPDTVSMKRPRRKSTT